MFEKEATEYAIIGWDKSSDPRDVFTPRIDETKFNDWRNGAEFGYNKANEWHKDLPTEDVTLAIIEVKDCGYLLCEYRKGIWYDNGSSAVCKDWITQNIKRWKEIVLQKESE